MKEVIYFVTGNDKKWREIEAILGDKIPIQRANIDLPEIQGESIEEIAKYKAIYAARELKAPVITEDTALSFHALKGLPGPYIKWFLKALGCSGLIKMLAGFEGDRSASAICTLAYCPQVDAEPILLQGVTVGRIAEEPRGPGNFGWDPIFIPDGHSQTYDEMPSDLKNQISHRAKALIKLQEHFSTSSK